jgi:L-malate glycosyltransferase
LKLAVISNIAGCSWAGSEELWLATALLALNQGWEVSAVLHSDLHSAHPLQPFRSAGGRVIGWKQRSIARLQRIEERIRPQFTTAHLGHPDLILVSAGSLPALTYVPGLVRFLQSISIPIVIICQFNSDALQFSCSIRQEIRCLIGKAAWTVFVSEENRSVARRQFADRLSSSSVLSNPIRAFTKEPLSPRSGFQGLEAVFGSVARFETCWKGQDLLFEILSSEKWLRRSWILRLFGEGPDRNHLKNLAAMFGLKDRVFFEGYVREVNDIWSQTDILLMPSRGEGTPLALLEAMMCGRPAIATKVGGIPEVLTSGFNGYLADAPTASCFGAELEKAWQSRRQWHEMGLRAHQAAKSLGQRDPAEELYKIIQLILEGKPQG